MTDLPARKHLRLPSYDYSSNGCYFVTICTKDRKAILSRIRVGRGLAPAETALTPIGRIAEGQIKALSERFPSVTVDKYVVMPNHIHFLIVLSQAAGASPRPTLSNVICAFKSLTTLHCRKEILFAGQLFQTSYYDHVVRDERDYLEKWQYIDGNPARWAEDELYTKEEPF